MKRLRFHELVVLVLVILFAASMVPAAAISEDFEGLSGSVLPSGWTLADNNGGSAGPVNTKTCLHSGQQTFLPCSLSTMSRGAAQLGQGR